LRMFFLFIHFVHSKGDILAVRPNVECGASYRLSYICCICARMPVLHLHLLTSMDCLINDTTFWIIQSHTRNVYDTTTRLVISYIYTRLFSAIVDIWYNGISISLMIIYYDDTILTSSVSFKMSSIASDFNL